MRFILLILAALFSFSFLSEAQSVNDPDDIFKKARDAAFVDKDESRAIRLASHALRMSPHYADVAVFLGRLYSWNHNYDSASFYFRQVLSFAPANEEASKAYIDLQLANNNYQSALDICNNALESSYAPSALLLKKAKILTAMKRFKEASAITDQLLKSDGPNADALILASQLRDAVAVNKIGINYDHSRFDKEYSTPWNMGSISYGRQTGIGFISTNINYANRFGKQGWQQEIEAYPHINKTLYSYVGIGYSPGESVFPKYRAGFSIYANLPLKYEAELGMRYLNFGSATLIYTGSISKYFGNFLFGFRTYQTPGFSGMSQSYSITGRLYLNAINNYVGLLLGTGISPDDRLTGLQFNNKYRSSSRQAAVSFSHSIGRMNTISIKAGVLNQENQPQLTRNEFDLSIGMQRRF